MSVIRKRGKTKFMWLPVTPSTTFSANGLVEFSSGYLIEFTSTSAGSDCPGVIRHAIAATDSDYAVARSVEVEVPVEKNVVWEIDVTSGLVAADVGLWQDMTSNLVVNRGASTYDVVQCQKVISTTKGEFILNIGTESLGVVGD
jgi:hypothetical protein